MTNDEAPSTKNAALPQDPLKFHFIKAGNRPLFAVPQAPARLRNAAVRCYPAHTWKKRVLRDAFLGASRVGVARWLFPATNLPLPGVPAGDFADWLSDIQARIGSSMLLPMLAWPGDPTRGRVYLHLLDESGITKAFCKLSLDQPNDALIRHEGETLAGLAHLDLKLCRIPEVIATGRLGGHESLVVSRASNHARASDWQRDRPIDDVIREYAGTTRTLSREDACRLPWWSGLTGFCRDRPEFHANVNRAAAAGVQVCRIHGDLNQTNVLRDGDDIWLLDWEQSQADGPCLTDPVCAAVDYLCCLHPNDPHGNARKFRNRFLDGHDETTRNQAILALAYLGSVRFTPAIAIIDAWPQT